MQLFGTMKGTKPHRQMVKSVVISIAEMLEITLVQNDVPVTLFYKHGNYPWRHIRINDMFSADGVPRHSDIYISCSASNEEEVIYDIRY